MDPVCSPIQREAFRKFRATFFLVTLALIGVMMTVFGGVGWVVLRSSQVEQERAATVFVPVEATVVESRVHRYQSSKGSQGPWSEIVYRWSVGGSSYTSNRYTTYGPSSDLTLVQRHPVGSKVTAYYDPADPSRAVLARDDSVIKAYRPLNLFAIVPLVLGIVLVASAAAVVVRRVRELRRAPGPADGPRLRPSGGAQDE
jgi:hypothetical protein